MSALMPALPESRLRMPSPAVAIYEPFDCIKFTASRGN
jgi:hypothetical protein